MLNNSQQRRTCGWINVVTLTCLWESVPSILVWPSCSLIYYIHSTSKHTHTQTRSDIEAQTECVLDMREVTDSWAATPEGAEWSGSPAGTLTFTLKCFNRTKVDKGRQWRIRSYNGLSTLQVRWACYWTELFPSPQSLISLRKLVINKKCRLIAANVTSWLTSFFCLC